MRDKPTTMLRTMLCLATVLLPAAAMAQSFDPGSGLIDLTGSADSQNNAVLSPLFSVQRDHTGAEAEQGVFASDALSVNLGMELTPVNGLSVRADAWRLDAENGPQASLGDLSNLTVTGLPSLFRDQDALAGVSPEKSFSSAGVKTNGIDLGASYVFETNKSGQFTLSTKATYLYDYRQIPGLLEASPAAVTELPANPDIQGALSLSWDFGNHSASATTNYFDSFKDLSEMNIEEINRLVDDIVTFDLQYGYSIKTGKQERAVFSFGIRNIFDKKTTQILNNSSRIVDQNGRVAYGSIKYQF